MAAFVYGAGGSADSFGASGSSTRGLEASIMLIDAKTKDVVWAYEVHKNSHGGLLLGTLAARGKQSVAEACAKHLKEFIEKSEGGRETSSSSLTITPIAQRSANSNSPATSERTPFLIPRAGNSTSVKQKT